METLEESPTLSGGGTFVLPELAATIPAVIGRMAHQNQALARFALAAEKAGILLPGGQFDDIDPVVVRQWNAYFEAALDGAAKTALSGRPVIFVDDEHFGIRIQPVSNLNAYRLKPVVEALEKRVPGVGWFVVDVLNAVNGHGLTIYDSAKLGYEAENYFYGQHSDRDAAVEMAGQEDDGDFDPKNASDEEIATFLDGFFSFYPSDVIKSVDGHKHLLTWLEKGEKGPKKATRRDVQRALKMGKLKGNLKRVVLEALELEALLRRDKDHCFNAFHALDGEVSDLIGATCFIAWDDPTFLFEMVQHSEESAYNSGETEEMLALRYIDLSAEQKEFDQLALDFKAYLECWSTLARLVKNFPLYEE